MSPIHICGKYGGVVGFRQDRGEEEELLEDLKGNLMGLTMVIPIFHLEDIPRHMQRHSIGVVEGFR